MLIKNRKPIKFYLVLENMEKVRTVAPRLVLGRIVVSVVWCRRRNKSVLSNEGNYIRMISF